MDVYKLKGNCENEEFRALLYTCCEYGNLFSLCYSDGFPPEMAHPLETALKPYLIAQQKVNQWFGYYNVPGCTGSSGSHSKILQGYLLYKRAGG